MIKLQLNHVSYIYSKGTPFQKTALDDVTIGFEAGKITGLIGHTGSGKSSLVNLLNGLYRPTTGEVLLDGENIWNNLREINKIRARVGLVMQYPEYQLFDETVRADIGFGPRNLGLDSEEIDRRVNEAVSFVGIDESLLTKSPFELSGGQQRRVAIAGILAMEPEVLVLDEPAAGLDPRGSKEIMNGLVRYAREKGVTVILVSHSMEDMATYCDNVVVMYQSRIYKSGTVEEIFRDATSLTEVLLNVPQVSQIMTKLKNSGIKLEGNLYTVSRALDSIIAYLSEVVE